MSVVLISVVKYVCSLELVIQITGARENLCYGYSQFVHSDFQYNARIAMNAMLIIFSLIEIVVSVYAIVICIQGCCGGKSSKHAAVPVGFVRFRTTSYQFK